MVGGPPGWDQPREPAVCSDAGLSTSSISESGSSVPRTSSPATVTPLRKPSSASLASRSACVFSARGTQVYVVPGGASSLGLRRQRPHVGVLDLPAPRHLLDDELGVHPDLDLGVRGELAAIRSPAIRPEYSATLLVATPIVVPSSASTSPVLASLSTAPYAAGPGLPREPPSASMRTTATHRPDSDVRTRIREHSSQRTTSSEGALAITARSEGLMVIWQPLHRRARSAAARHALLGHAELVVERHQVVGQARRPRWPGRPPHAASSSLISTARASRAVVASASCCSIGGQLDGGGVEGALGLLELLHHLELDVLEVADPALQRLELVAASARGPWGW